MAYLALSNDVAEAIRKRVVETLDVEGIVSAVSPKLQEAVDAATDALWDKVLEQLQTDIEWELQDIVRRHFEDWIEALLTGDEDRMRQVVGATATYTGRDDAPWVWVEQRGGRGPVALRRKIVEANLDLIASERIADQEIEIAALRDELQKVRAQLPPLRGAA